MSQRFSAIVGWCLTLATCYIHVNAKLSKVPEYLLEEEKGDGKKDFIMFAFWLLFPLSSNCLTWFHHDSKFTTHSKHAESSYAFSATKSMNVTTQCCLRTKTNQNGLKYVLGLPSLLLALSLYISFSICHMLFVKPFRLHIHVSQNVICSQLVPPGFCGPFLW